MRQKTVPEKARSIALDLLPLAAHWANWSFNSANFTITCIARFTGVAMPSCAPLRTI